MSLARPGEFPGLEEVEGESYSPTHIPGVPAGAMPELDLSGLVPSSSLIIEIASVQIPSKQEIMKDEN